MAGIIPEKDWAKQEKAARSLFQWSWKQIGEASGERQPLKKSWVASWQCWLARSQIKAVLSVWLNSGIEWRIRPLNGWLQLIWEKASACVKTWTNRKAQTNQQSLGSGRKKNQKRRKKETRRNWNWKRKLKMRSPRKMKMISWNPLKNWSCWPRTCAEYTCIASGAGLCSMMTRICLQIARDLPEKITDSVFIYARWKSVIISPFSIIQKLVENPPNIFTENLKALKGIL